MEMLGVIKTQIVFTFGLVDLGCWTTSRLGLQKVEGVQVVQALLRMSTWKIALAFPYGMKSERAVTEQVKPGECFPGYGQQNLKL